MKHIIDIWIEELHNYTIEQLLAKPSPEDWSLGQVYMHLISETGYFLEQSRWCLLNNENANEEMSAEAKSIFNNNSFPNLQLKGPPTNASTPQPRGKDALLQSLLQLRKEMSEVERSFAKHSAKGKTKHPGLNYFNAEEWFRFAELHLRHHLQQKRRIDAFLQK